MIYSRDGVDERSEFSMIQGWIDFLPIMCNWNVDLVVISRLIWRTKQILQSQIKVLYRVEDVQLMYYFVLKELKKQAWRGQIFTGLLQDRCPGTEVSCIFLSYFTSEKLSHVWVRLFLK